MHVIHSFISIWGVGQDSAVGWCKGLSSRPSGKVPLPVMRWAE